MPDNILALVIISSITFTGIAIGSYLLGNGKEGGLPVSRATSLLLACICVEIFLATTALFFRDNEPVWTVLRIAGRVIEFIGVASFLRFLFRK